METAHHEPLRQTRRFDPAGDYVRRYVPELAAHSRNSIHTPWPLDSGLAYPGPLVELSCPCHPVPFGQKDLSSERSVVRAPHPVVSIC